MKRDSDELRRMMDRFEDTVRRVGVERHPAAHRDPP